MARDIERFESPEETAAREERSRMNYRGGSSNYGSPPYQESAFKAALRMLASGLGGLSAVRPDANFGEAFMQSAGRSSVLRQQSEQAAMDYAMRQQEAKRRTEEDEIQKRLMEAQIKQMETEKPLPEPKPQAWVPQTREEWEGAERFKASLKPTPTAKGGSAKAPAAPKPRAAVMNRLDLINQADVNNPEHLARLQAIVKNPATPEERDAALRKLEMAPGLYRAR